MGLKDLLEKCREPVMALACAVLAYGLLRMVEEVFEKHIKIETHIYAELAILVIVWFVLTHRVDAQKKLEVLNRETTTLHQTIQRTIDSSLLSQKTANNFNEIQSIIYDPSVSEVVRELEGYQDGLNLIGVVEKTSAEMLTLVKRSPYSRILIERLVRANLSNIETHNYVLSLETYCNLIIDLINVGLKRSSAEGKTCVVYSFTNVTPKDWFFEREVIGNPLSGYALKVKQLVAKMKSQKHIFQRHVLCRGAEMQSPTTNSMIDLPGLSDIRLNWMNCNPSEREIYLHDYHTSEACAQILAVDLPNLKFYHNCTEFVFFGTAKRDSHSIDDINWWCCFGAGYTSNNVNVSASFINLENNYNAHLLLIDIPNVSRLITDEGTRILSQRIQISAKEFPRFMLAGNDIYAHTYMFKNLLTLAMKWHLASEIWHSSIPEQEFEERFLAREIPDKSLEILDCACGTGHHSFLLKQRGYNITASDYDKDNITLFDRLKERKGLQISTSRVDWHDFQTELRQKTFDVILCLGSSLPYYKSWKENGVDYEFKEDEVKGIIENFKRALKPAGKLIIGLSRYINKSFTENHLKFLPKPITGSLSNARDADYEMTWSFKYDWEKRKRKWDCVIKNNYDDDFSFSLVSHLFDIEDLQRYCQDVFGEHNVRVEDLGTNYYDIYVVCELKPDGSTTP